MRRWPYTFAVILSVAVGGSAFTASRILDLPIRDPDGFLGPSYVRLPIVVVAFFAVGIIPAALRRHGARGFFRAAGEILDEEWSWKRLSYILVGLGSFYTCYVSYRNLKSYLPVVREGVLFDHRMLELDHYLMFGHNPATVLHNLLGTDVAAYILANIYVSYLMLIPLTLGAFLVWGRDLSLGAWYATTLSLNWVLGAVSYYMLPTLGPAFAQPSMFLDLPDTSAAALQRSLFRSGAGFKEDPGSHNIYGIAGFASLHVSVVLAACLFFARAGMNRIVRWTSWVYLALVVLATIYFGWHYIADDIAGALIGWASVSIGAWASGNRGRRRRHRKGDLVTVHGEPQTEAELVDAEFDNSAGTSETASSTA
ncbi:MAG: phosphatase PAP2 family protein [Aeromicrobium sp.]